MSAAPTQTTRHAKSLSRLLRALGCGLGGSALLVAAACAPDLDGEQDLEPATGPKPDAQPATQPATDHDDAGADHALDAARDDLAEPSRGPLEALDADAQLPLGATREQDAAEDRVADASLRPEASGRDAADLPHELTIHLAGDSTVSTYADTSSTRDQAGWGQMLAPLFRDGIAVDNRAIGGRTARRFLDEKRLDQLLDATEPGDYVFVQFGTNDGHRSATYELNGKTYPYYADPQTDFRATLQTYLERIAAREATPVLVTPPPRNSAYCTGGNGTGAHAEAMRQLGQERGVAVLDLNARSVAYLKAICPAPQPEDFFFLRADGSVDGTHFQEHGARVLASLVAAAIVAAELPLSRALREKPP